jgi:hypothetical protein
MDILMTSPRRSSLSIPSQSDLSDQDDLRTIREHRSGDLIHPSDRIPSPDDNDNDNESTSSTSDTEDMEGDERAEAVVADLNNDIEEKVSVSSPIVRILALLCACSLSIGSH